jgi:AcrR family transcriptional regulator
MILERDGAEGLTMQAVATAVGIRAPSLYKHVAHRGELLRLVLDETVRELGSRLADVPARSPHARIRWLADEFRAFARERPVAFGLLFSALPEESRVDPAANAAAVRPLIEAVTELAGPEHALDASRTLTAACFGFVTMELAGAFRLGGSVEGAWKYLVEALLRALAGQPEEAPLPRARGSTRA